ncbi:hypothetical protein VE04_05528 [Pseudogymnoascus sp. 24MN13]|nr:hypothetical protein VE04_05528 [Pseudogymnoascus sp. 24MN13]
MRLYLHDNVADEEARYVNGEPEARAFWRTLVTDCAAFPIVRLDETQIAEDDRRFWALMGGGHPNVITLDPKKDCPPNIMSTFGKDMAQNAQGIYYWDSFDKARVPTDQNLFIPSFKNIDWDNPAEADRSGRARVVGTHMVNNETYCKSEFAWEADT